MKIEMQNVIYALLLSMCLGLKSIQLSSIPSSNARAFEEELFIHHCGGRFLALSNFQWACLKFLGPRPGLGTRLHWTWKCSPAS